MVRISIYNEYVDVPNDLQLSFQKKNNLFAFDDIECERTTSFTLPATSTNICLFSYGNRVDISTDITDVTSRIPARVELSGLIIEGFLYVSQCNENDFDCVFVFGKDSLRLKTIKELGSIKDIVDTDSSVLFGLYQAVNAENTNSMDIACAWYLSFIDNLPTNEPHYEELTPGIDVLAPFPSANTRLIAVQAASRAAFKPYIDTANFNNMRLIPNKIEPDSNCLFTMDGYVTITKQPDVVGKFSAATDFAVLFAEDSVVEYIGGEGGSPGNPDGDRHIGTFNYLAPNMDLVLTFPSDFPNDVYLVSEMKMEEPVSIFYAPKPNCKFLGGYSYDFEKKESVGESLAGRSVNIKTYYTDEDGIVKIDKFMFYKFPAGISYYNTSGVLYNFKKDIITMSSSVNVSFADKTKSLGRVRLQDIYPEMDFVSFYKSIAYVQGDFVTLTDGKIRITTPEEVTKKLKYIDVSDRVVSQRKSIKRTFSDYAQRNDVVFDSADYVTDSNARTYTINNSLLSENKKIYTIPYNYGGITLVRGLGILSNSSIALVNKTATEGVAKNYTLANVSSSLKTFLRRASITDNPIIRKLCNNALQQSVTISMPVYLYNLIDEYTILTINGQKWVWLDARYSDGEADFTLQLYE